MLKSDVLIESKSLRESVIDRVDVLDKVKKLFMLPDDIHATTEMVANFYEVSTEIIRKATSRKKEELESDGMKTIKGKELSDMKWLCGLSQNIGRLTLYTRRSILRIGMLLEESKVAQAVRDKLLDIEEEKQQQSTNIVQIPTELNMIGQLLEVSNQSFKAMIQMQTQIDETNKVARMADERAQEALKENDALKTEINDMKQGLVDVDLPLRSQFNDAVRKFKARSGLSFEDAYNRVYDILSKQQHIDIKKRTQNRVEKGEKVKPIDIIEELNLLVPAIRLAKSLAGIAS